MNALDRRRRLEDVREALLSTPELRAGTEILAQALLTDVADLDDGEPAPDWITVHDSGLTAGELRERLRLLLAELAERDE